MFVQFKAAKTVDFKILGEERNCEALLPFQNMLASVYKGGFFCILHHTLIMTRTLPTSTPHYSSVIPEHFASSH